MTRDRDQTGPQARDEIVQRFLDGDLTPQEASEAREMMASDPGLRRDADAYRRLGHLLREAAGTQDLEGEVGSAWERVSDGIGGPAADDSGPGVASVWLGEFFRHRKRYWIPVAGAVAGAAAALVVTLNVHEVPDIPVGVDQAEELRSRVTDISLHSASTMIIEVETAAGGTAAILWVTEEAEEPDEEEEPADDATE